MLIVQTTRREGVSYLEETLAQVGDVGGRMKLIVSDGPLPADFKTPRGWKVLELPKRGARATGWECLMRGLLSASSKDLILLQDDLEICQDGGHVMDRLVVPPTCIAATFYTPFSLPGVQPKSPGPARIIVMRASGTAQALKFPRAALEILCSLDPLKAPQVPPLEPHLFDDSLFSHARFSALPNVAHVMPNPVKHRGQISACGSTNRHHPQWTVDRDARFPGEPTTLPIVEPR